MEEQWRSDRAKLEQLLHLHPEWTVPQLAAEVKRCISWVKKWRKRLAEASPTDLKRFSSRSRAHHAPYHRWDKRVEDCILAMRESPPENLHRVPGPKALLYYLPRDAQMQELGLPLPRSTRTICKILHKYGLIVPRKTVIRQPLARREPLEEVQMDFKDVSTVPSSESLAAAKSNILWKPAILSTQALPCCFLLRLVKTFMLKRRCKQLLPSC